MTDLAAVLERRPPGSLTFDGGRGPLTAIELSAAARGAAEQLPAGISRLLIHSGDATTIAAHLLAAQMRGISLFLAHEHLGAEEIEAVVRMQEIDALWTAGQLLRRTSAESRGGNEHYIYLMTSGTTNQPKIARHTLSSLLGRVERFAGDPNLERGRWLLTYTPTTFAGMQVILTALVTGGCLILPADRTMQCLWETAHRHGATHVSGTPTFWRSFLMLCSNQARLDTLRQITLGGEAVDQNTLDRLRAFFPAARITHIYASTEAGALFSVDDGRAGFPAGWLDQPVSNVRLRIEDGELQVWSPRRMEGYVSTHDNPFLDAGWLRTGDLARVDGDRVHFAGRKDATINVGGMKVQPLEVETILLEVEGILEACVFGIANPVTGQLVIADIVVHPGKDVQDVRRNAAAHARERLPSYKVPRSIRVVDSIATSQAGKKLNAAASA